MRWGPRSFVIGVFAFLLLLSLDIYKPTWVRTVHQLASTTVAVWIFVYNIFDFNALFSATSVLAISLFTSQILLPCHRPSVNRAIFIHERNYRHALLLAQIVILFAVGWCLVNNTRTVFYCYEIGCKYAVSIWPAIFEQRGWYFLPTNSEPFIFLQQYMPKAYVFHL